MTRRRPDPPRFGPRAEGGWVRITGGPYAGETGVIIEVPGPAAVNVRIPGRGDVAVAQEDAEVAPPPRPAVHDAQGDSPMRDGYRYDSGGRGVRDDLVQAVLDRWASVDPSGDPSGPLRHVGDGYVNDVGNLARMAAHAVAEIWEAEARS